ncbi:MAG: RNA methyltransferase [Proteobacteria bacterium]|nr:RNA methyltransferase [Pseudomonadota bacterium]
MTGLVISALGARGDGIAAGPAGIEHVPFALPGETVTVASDGTYTVEPSSPDRIAPFCPHYGRCGGCRMQHLAPGPYAEWKRGLVASTLRRAGLETDITPMVGAHGAGRRRVILHARVEKGRWQAGFMVAKSHELVDLDSCPVLVPALGTAPELARRILQPLVRLGKPADVQITATDGGIDVDIRGPGREALSHRLALTEMATALDLARLSLHGEIIVERRAPTLRMGRAVVNPPPGGFLQATAAGEQTLAELVVAALGKARKVADLFSGVGPFALRLAESRSVSAFDSDRPAIEALSRAARATPGLRPIAAEARDLFRRPLLPHELDAFDALVLDPPRAGAEAQVRQIARSKARHLVYVSCDPASFARDSALLTDAGFSLKSVTPVDQFAFSAHIELVAALTR